MRKFVGVLIYIGIVIAWLLILAFLRQVPDFVINVAKAAHGKPFTPSEARVGAIIAGVYNLALYAGGGDFLKQCASSSG